MIDYYLRQDSGISGLLEHVNLNLLQAGLQIQKNYMKTNSNWNENYGLTQVINQNFWGESPKLGRRL